MGICLISNLVIFEQTNFMKKAHPLIFSLDRSRQQPLFRQLYEAVKEQITVGTLNEGDPLPATRTLAVELGISRSSVVNAYEQLLTEGYIEGVRGAGYRVQAVGELKHNARVPPAARRELHPAEALGENALFDARALDSALFPVHQWAKTISRLCRQEPNTMMFGEADRANQLLRQAIALHVYEWRGIACEPEQIVITAGSTEALEICINTLSRDGDIFNIEDPCYSPVRSCIEANHRRTHRLPVDDDGAQASALHPQSRLAIITPSHQFPLGGTMSVGRRMEFIYWAQKHNGWIIEDDYDSEFRYGGRPIPALAAFDKIGRTLYIGSFSKLFSSSLRISYLILPPQLIATFRHAQAQAKVSMLPQRVLAEFIFNGECYKYLRRVRKIYAQRRQHLLNCLRDQLGEFGSVRDHKAGTLLVFHLHRTISDVRVVEKARQQQLSVRALSGFCFDKSAWNGLVMGFVAWDEAVLSAGVATLKAIVQEVAGEAE